MSASSRPVETLKLRSGRQEIIVLIDHETKSSDGTVSVRFSNSDTAMQFCERNNLNDEFNMAVCDDNNLNPVSSFCVQVPHSFYLQMKNSAIPQTDKPQITTDNPKRFLNKTPHFINAQSYLNFFENPDLSLEIAINFLTSLDEDKNYFIQLDRNFTISLMRDKDAIILTSIELLAIGKISGSALSAALRDIVKIFKLKQIQEKNMKDHLLGLAFDNESFARLLHAITGNPLISFGLARDTFLKYVNGSNINPAVNSQAEEKIDSTSTCGFIKIRTGTGKEINVETLETDAASDSLHLRFETLPDANEVGEYLKTLPLGNMESLNTIHIDDRIRSKGRFVDARVAYILISRFDFEILSGFQSANTNEEDEKKQESTVRPASKSASSSMPTSTPPGQASDAIDSLNRVFNNYLTQHEDLETNVETNDKNLNEIASTFLKTYRSIKEGNETRIPYTNEIIFVVRSTFGRTTLLEIELRDEKTPLAEPIRITDSTTLHEMITHLTLTYQLSTTDTVILAPDLGLRFGEHAFEKLMAELLSKIPTKELLLDAFENAWYQTQTLSSDSDKEQNNNDSISGQTESLSLTANHFLMNNSDEKTNNPTSGQAGSLSLSSNHFALNNLETTDNNFDEITGQPGSSSITSNHFLMNNNNNSVSLNGSHLPSPPSRQPLSDITPRDDKRIDNGLETKNEVLQVCTHRGGYRLEVLPFGGNIHLPFDNVYDCDDVQAYLNSFELCVITCLNGYDTDLINHKLKRNHTLYLQIPAIVFELITAMMANAQKEHEEKLKKTSLPAGGTPESQNDNGSLQPIEIEMKDFRITQQSAHRNTPTDSDATAITQDSTPVVNTLDLESRNDEQSNEVKEENLSTVSDEELCSRLEKELAILTQIAAEGQKRLDKNPGNPTLIRMLMSLPKSPLNSTFAFFKSAGGATSQPTVDASTFTQSTNGANAGNHSTQIPAIRNPHS